MRGEKDEKMQLDHLFPRLLANSNTEKGGPRAPPRNKMALWEQVNTPSQRFSRGAMSTRPLPSSNGTNLVPSASLSHGHCQKMNGLSLFCSSTDHSHMPGRLHSNCLGPRYKEYQTLDSGNYRELNARPPWRMTTECTLHHPFGFYTSVNISANSLGKKDGFRNPCLGRRGNTMNSGVVVREVEKDRAISSTLQSSGKHQTAFGEKEQGKERTYVISRKHARDQAADNFRVSETRNENAQMLGLLPSTDDKVSAETALGVLAVHTTHESVCRNLPPETACVETVSGDPERLSRKRSSSAMEKTACSSLHGENNRMPHWIESVNESPKGNDCESSRVDEVKRSGAVWDASVVASKSRVDISPEDVVRLIGPKFFWLVQRTITHQQKIFEAQIFELHRLIKVQRLIAASPDMLLEGNVIFSEPVNFYTQKKLQLEIFPERPAPFLRPKVDSPKPKPCPDYAAKDVQEKLPPTGDTRQGDINPNSTMKQNSGAITATSFVPEEAKLAKLAPLCLGAPSVHQWLVPVRSPSEGLIYKPCTGPYPPTAGSVALVYGGYGSMNFTRMDAAHVNIAYGVPASNQQGVVLYSFPDTFGRSYCQTYAHDPEINTFNPNSAVMQFGTAHSSGKDNQQSTNDINYIIPHRSSCNVSQDSGIMKDSVRNLPVSKCSDVRVISGSSHSLFPITPTDETSRHSAQNQNSPRKIQVIKVVPHNPKSASESAARIFRSIQEERKQD